jgi:hypothetical protein
MVSAARDELDGAGIACGLIGAEPLTRVRESLLFGVSAHDVAAFTAPPAVLAGRGTGSVPCAGAVGYLGASDGGATGEWAGRYYLII